MKQQLRTTLHGLTLVYVIVFAVAALADEAAAQRLLDQHQALEPRLRQNQFMRPVVLDSMELADKVAGEIFVVVDYPFATVSSALTDPEDWCDVMSLHINTKYCRAAVTPGGTLLTVHLGKKTPQKLQDAAQLQFNYTTLSQTPGYFAISLDADKGLLGTSNYRIGLEAVPLPNEQSFLHLTFSYSMGLMARVAIKTYLATIGRGKVGFTAVGERVDGESPRFIGGVRAVAERNTMRYYLAIESFLAAAGGAPAAQLDMRLQSWFSAVEMYPQLYELDRSQYLTMKHDEYQRQQTDNPSPGW